MTARWSLYVGFVFKNVTYSFLSGSPRDLNTEYAIDVSRFSTIAYDDPREGYSISTNISQTGLSTQLQEETNLSVCGMMASVLAGQTFYQEFSPMTVWIGPVMIPDVGIHVTNVQSDVSVVERGKNKISVRPNPATDNFNVVLPEAGAAQIELFNLVGQKVYTANTTEQTVNINVSDLNSGVYMLKVMQNGVVETSKVVVK